MDTRVSGSVELRPTRLGLAVAPGSAEGVQRAIQIASCCWGGATFPILECDATLDAQTALASDFGVDAVLACDDDERCRALGTAPGFEWHSLRGLPFSGEHADRLVDLSTVLVAIRRSGRPVAAAALPRVYEWSHDDPLAGLFSAMFGRLDGGSEQERLVASRIRKDLPHDQIGIDSDLPVGISWIDSALRLGGWEVSSLNGTANTGVVVIDPTSTADLVRFWNLRALGNATIAWPLSAHARFREYTRSLIEQLPRGRWGDAPHEELYVWTSLDEVPSELRELLPNEREVRLIRSGVPMRQEAAFYQGVATRFRSQFDVPLLGSPTTGESIRIPIPRTDLLPDQPVWAPDVYCSVRVTIYSERGMREQASYRVPNLRLLAPTLQFEVAPVHPVVRGVGDGLVACHRIDEAELQLGLPDSVSLIGRLLRDAGLKTHVSEAGRWMSRITDALGGAGSALASQPAVRDVLDAAAAGTGATPERLAAVAKEKSGAWPQAARLWLHGRRYATWVLGVLSTRRLLTPTFDYRCQACQLRQQVAAEFLSAVLRCEDCGFESPLAVQLVTQGTWRLRTRNLLSQKRLRATFPIISTLAVLSELAPGRVERMHYTLGLAVDAPGRAFEIDFAVLWQDHGGVILLLGEAKARKDLDESDVDNLEVVQDAVRAIGVECFIAVVNSNEKLSAADADRLRRSADRALPGLAWRIGMAQYTNLPLILTRSPLTVPGDHPEHPRQMLRHRLESLPDLAIASCKRELGLVGFGPPPHWDRPIWGGGENPKRAVPAIQDRPS